jgi:CO/xanthine dehydrogenase FAD-binding subunit
MDLASMNAAVVIIRPQDAKGREIRIALGAVAPKPVRAGAIEELLAGQQADEKLFERLREEISRDLQPRATSLRASPEYKKRMAGVLVIRALRKLLSRP